ncbi:MAG: PEGA domain-containing protein [Fibrobacteraceae bacterium]|nr:PEGA domain-containing protein [Fibrobacteraceae bacterium]
MKHLSLIALFVAFLTMSAFADEDPPPRGKPATVTIITNPPNSDVYLGGELLGKSPIENMKVTSGRQTLVVIDQGFELVNERVNVWPGKPNKFDYGTKIPKGNIKISTKPGKCIIYIDGDNADKTDGAPLTIHNLDAGDHVVRAECSNRKSAEALVTVKGEETVEVELDATSGKKKK